MTRFGKPEVRVGGFSSCVQTAVSPWRPPWRMSDGFVADVRRFSWQMANDFRGRWPIVEGKRRIANGVVRRSRVSADPQLQHRLRLARPEVAVGPSASELPLSA